MANKAMGTRQKLVFRLDATQSKPRNLVAQSMKISGAGSHKKSNASQRQLHKQALKKLPTDGEAD